MRVNGFLVQDDPKIYCASIPGSWLLEHTTPTWRAKDPEEGFQRIVNQKRARQIAVAVLDQGRTFPNAIVLATDAPELTISKCQVELDEGIKLLVVDGQHRLWAQKFSENAVSYPAMVHAGLTEVEMAELFLEINDNQKRVPSSLRWDLVRLVRPDDDPVAIETAELIYEMNNEPKGPLYQRVDLTGEQGEISLKQGSLAPEIKRLLNQSIVRDLSFESKYDLLTNYLTAIRSLSPDDWDQGRAVFYKARVLRALIRLLASIGEEENLKEMKPQDYRGYLTKIDVEALDSESLRAAQGSAGIKAIHDEIKSQILE